MNNLTRVPINDSWDLPWSRLQVPTFKEMNLGAWSIRWMEPLAQWRYFHDELIQAGQYTLLKDDESWMSTAPVEIEGQAQHVAAARGHVVVMGAGLGVALYNILNKPMVTRVTLVERDASVIQLVRAAAGLDHWGGIEKLEIEIVDAFDFRPRTMVDHLYVDIWAKAADARALADTQRIQSAVRAATVGWWTQEFSFLDWLEQKFSDGSPTLERYKSWAQEIELPMIGQDDGAYMECIIRLARGAFYRDVLRQAGAVRA
jgi:hypothetical protein